jgi:hypothetical protein
MFPRLLWCALLVAITGFARIAIAGPSQDVDHARRQLALAMQPVAKELMKKAEQDRQTIKTILFERTHAEQAKFLQTFVMAEVHRGVRRADAEMAGKERLEEMVSQVVDAVVQWGTHPAQNLPNAPRS